MKCGMKLLIVSHGAGVEVWEWIGNFIPHFTGHVFTFPWLGWNQSMIVKGTAGMWLETIQLFTTYFYVLRMLHSLSWTVPLCTAKHIDIVTVKPVYNDHLMGYFSAKGHLDEPQKAEIVNTSKMVPSVITINTLLNKSQVIHFIIEVVVTDRFHCTVIQTTVQNFGLVNPDQCLLL